MADALDDDKVPAEAAVADELLRSHWRVMGGEPIGDAALRGWQMHNGVDFESEFDRDGVHDE